MNMNIDNETPYIACDSPSDTLTKERELLLIKYASIVGNWKKMLCIFPEYKHPRFLQRHYSILLRQKEDDEILKNQFANYPTPLWLKIDFSREVTLTPEEYLDIQESPVRSPVDFGLSEPFLKELSLDPKLFKKLQDIQNIYYELPTESSSSYVDFYN